MSTRTLDEIIARVKRLPRLPDTAVRLASVLGDPDSSIEQIVDTIRYDQTVTADVLRLCNSAYFGLSKRVESIDDAVRLLGTAKVLQLVMSAHVQTMLQRPQEGYGLMPGALWEHSVAVALGCREFAQRIAPERVGLSFTLGLLHDIGKVVLNEYVAAEYAEIVRRATDEQLSFVEVEEQVLGFTHAEVGGRLAERWSLPESLIHSVRYHHEPEKSPTPDLLLDSVHLADATCLVMGIGSGMVDGLAYRAEPAVLERHGFSAQDLEMIGAGIVVEMKSVRDLFAGKA